MIEKEKNKEVKATLNKIKMVTKNLEDISIISETSHLVIKGMIKRMSDFSKTQLLLETFNEKIKSLLDFSHKLEEISILHGYHVDKLNEFYWVSPYKYNQSVINDIYSLKTKEEFNNYIETYFNDKKVNCLFDEFKSIIKQNDKQILMDQIKENFFNNNYSICITALITIFDGLSLQLISDDSSYMHKSRLALKKLMEDINNETIEKYSYEYFIRLDILSHFINKLYKPNSLKKPKKIDLCRHVNSHGAYYSNEKINVLRILNAIYECQTLINDSKKIGIYKIFSEKNGSLKVKNSKRHRNNTRQNKK